jgi:hypothetical protein
VSVIRYFSPRRYWYFPILAKITRKLHFDLEVYRHDPGESDNPERRENSRTASFSNKSKKTVWSPWRKRREEKISLESELRKLPGVEEETDMIVPENPKKSWGQFNAHPSGDLRNPQSAVVGAAKDMR